MTRLLFAVLASIVLVPTAHAQSRAPALGDSAQALIGSWEFSNADRDRRCTAEFKTDRTGVGFKVEFDSNCGTLFPLVNQVAGWIFPENDLLRLLDAQGRTLAEFSEVESGIYEAPTPGVGVLFLQSAASVGPPPKPAEELAGEWKVTRNGSTLCALTLSMTPLREALTLTVKPGCDPAVARLNFTQWRLDRGELVLIAARGNPWRFEEIDNGAWRLLPEAVDPITLVRQ